MQLTIISGGQTGADQGGLDAAIMRGVPHGGYCPKGRICEGGTIPERYKLTETDNTSMAYRTVMNIVKSDVTVIFYRGKLDGGSSYTQKQCRKRHKHQIPVSLDGFEEAANASEYIVHCIRQRLKEAPKDPLTINVAGQRASKCPGIHDDVRSIMYGVIHRLITGE
jgi:hypothetical protein